MTDLDLNLTEAEIAIESLRKGIPPTGNLRHFTVGRDSQLRQLASTIQDREQHGPAALLVQANYGAGKTHLLRLIREIALAEGFAVALVTVDSRSGVRFNRMDQVSSAVMREIELPGRTGKGVGSLFDLFFALDVEDVPIGLSAQRNSLMNFGKWSRMQEIRSTPLWIALRGWHLSRSDEARDVAESWLAATWEFKSQRRYLYDHLVRALPPSIRSMQSESNMYQSGAFSFDKGGHENSWFALEDLHTLARLSGLKGLVLLFDEFEDVIQNLGNINYQRAAFANLIDLMSNEYFTGWKYFAVTPDFTARCRQTLENKFQHDFPVEMFDELGRIEMEPVCEQDFLALGKKVRATHGIAYEWQSIQRFPNTQLTKTISDLYARSSADQVRQAMIGLIAALDTAMEH